MVILLETALMVGLVILGAYCVKKLYQEDPHSASWMIGLIIICSLPMSALLAYKPILGISLTAVLVVSWFCRKSPWVAGTLFMAFLLWLIANHSQGVMNLWNAVVRHYYGG